MFYRPRAGSRGMAQLAFVGLVSLVGIGFAAGIAAGVDIGRESQVAAVLSADPPLDDTGGFGTKVPTEGIKKIQCNSMEVHTLRQVGSTQSDTVSKCFEESTGFDGVKRKVLRPAAGPGCGFAKEGKCVVRFCVPGSFAKDGKERCFTAKECEAGAGAKEEKCVSDSVSTFSKLSPKDLLAQAFKMFPEAERNNFLGALRPESQKLLNDAFATERTTIDKEIERKTTEIKAAEADLRRLRGECESGFWDTGICDYEKETAVARKIKEDKAALRKLEEDKKRLADAAKYLKPDDVTTGATACKSEACVRGETERKQQNQNNCPSGIKDASGNCVQQTTTFPGPGPGDGPGNSNPSGGLGQLLGALGKLFGGSNPLGQQKGAACPTDQNAYAQYQQQYNQQLQQYNAALQQYNYQVQVAQLQGLPPPPQPVAPVPCTPSSGTGSGSGQCASAPPVPTTACAAGWRPTYGGSSGAGSQCITGWQCGAGTGTNPVAQISCQPDLADVGMTVAISFGCQNATASNGQGFSTNGALSGSTTTIVSAPPENATAMNFALTCTNQGAVDSKQCSVRINKPSIVLVANPKTISSGQTSSIGWVTAGIESCVVSSPDNQAFTTENADKPKKSGVAQTPTLSQNTSFVLNCTTLAGGTKQATTTVSIQ